MYIYNVYGCFYRNNKFQLEIIRNLLLSHMALNIFPVTNQQKIIHTESVKLKKIIPQKKGIKELDVNKLKSEKLYEF